MFLDGCFQGHNQGFKGNGFTESQQVYKYVLMRACEVTLENGYSYFVILGNEDTTSKSFTAYASNSSFSVSQVTKPGRDICIQCFYKKPDVYGAIDALEYLSYNPIPKSR